jgi:hypothetical protein
MVNEVVKLLNDTTYFVMQKKFSRLYFCFEKRNTLTKKGYCSPYKYDEQ